MNETTTARTLAEQLTQNHVPDHTLRTRAAEELLRLDHLINHPSITGFLESAVLEAAHQAERFGEDDERKLPQDFYWLAGGLAYKALQSHLAGDRKALAHHCIAVAAVMASWHRVSESADARD